MKKRGTGRNDCDLVALNRDHIAWAGTAHVRTVAVKTSILPRPLVYPKSSIAYIHFKSLPYQTADYIQLTSGGSTTGEILNMPELDFTSAESGERVSIPRSALLILTFFCSLDAAVASSRARRRRKAKR
jgi:hypothetical protein